MLKQNLDALARHSPSTLYFMNQGIKAEPERVECIEAKSGALTLKIHTGERELLVHSGRDPEQEAERFVRKIEDTDGNFFVIYGMGLGYHVRSFFERVVKKSPLFKLLVIEPSFNVFNAALSRFDFSDIIAHP
ncbi:MAG: hypothetical protein ACOCWO_06145, partial [Candidatus Muiribacteriaceae bacterium]